MKRVIHILLAAALAIPAASYAAISGTKVWGNGGTVANGGWPATIDLTGHTPTAGNILVVCQARSNDDTGLSATTPAGFTAGPEYANGTAGALSGAMFWKKSAGNEASISATWSDTSISGSWTYAEIPGTDLNVDTLGDSGDNEADIASATTSLSSGSATNSTATGLAIACLMTDNGIDNDVTAWSNSFNEQQESNYASTARAETFIATKVLASSAAQSTAGTITSDQGYGGILVFNASGSTCPATCAGGRSARCITDTSNNTDPNNILYGQSPAVVANEDTVCYDSTSALGDTVNVTNTGYPSFASAGKTATDSFDYCIMDNGAACGTDGKYEVSFQPVISSVTGIGTGQTTGTVTVTPAGPTEGTVRGVAISKTSYDTYGAPTHAQAVQGVDANDANVAWGSEFTKSFLSTVSPGWTFSRASSQTYEKSDGTLGTVTSGNPAFQYSGGTAQGVLLEGARTNLLKYSAQVGGTNWTKRGTATATQNSAVAPDGTSTATLIAGIGSVGTNDIYQIVTGATASAALAPSIWIKKVSLTGVIYLANPASALYGAWNINLALLGNEWERITSTHPAVTIINPFIGSPSNQAGLQFAAAAGAPLSFYTGNTMIEIGAFSSSDIPTTTAAVSRVTTDLTRSWTFDTNTFSGYLQAYPGFASTDTSATNPVFSAYKDANNYLTITHPTTSGRMDLNLAIGGTTATAQVTGLTWAAGDKLDIRFRKNASGIKLWVEAGSTETTTGVAPNAFSTPPNTVRLGRDEGSNYGFWTVGNIQLWNSVDDTALGALN